jgi:hypothetical protein
MHSPGFLIRCKLSVNNLHHESSGQPNQIRLIFEAKKQKTRYIQNLGCGIRPLWVRRPHHSPQNTGPLKREALIYLVGAKGLEPLTFSV